jgi:hypothetical protein
MVIERFRDGNALPVYTRFQKEGRLAPDGLRYVESWVTVDLQRCYQLMDCEEEQVLLEWMQRWEDLVEFEYFAVMTSGEARERVAVRMAEHDESA